jgi:hypothetical protein
MASVIYYDEDCTLCKSLALFVEKRTKAFTVQSWQEASQEAGPVEQLRIRLENGELLEGVAAWTHLVEHYEGLRSLQWMFDRLGVPAATTGHILSQTGQMARRLCGGCGRRP